MTSGRNSSAFALPFRPAPFRLHAPKFAASFETFNNIWLSSANKSGVLKARCDDQLLPRRLAIPERIKGMGRTVNVAPQADSRYHVSSGGTSDAPMTADLVPEVDW
jgi:hypothetical protein